MSLWDSVTRLLAIEPMQERSIDSFTDHPGLTEQLAAVQGLQPRPWRVAGIREAMGVPAIFGAVNLISNLTGSLSMKALRGEVEMAPADRPRVIVRPDPFTIPREFYRGTTYNIATRGEAWWWIAARDIDDQPISVLNVNPAELTVTEDPRDLRYPIIEWRGVRMKNDDMRQLVYMREPGSLRGVGPLQLCGAAISVAVESQEWAANFFAEGGTPSIHAKSLVDIDDDEADTIKTKIATRDANTPIVTGPNIDLKEFGVNVQGAQMLEARSRSVGDVAVMFNIPGTLLEYVVSGSSLTYQNVGSEFEKLLRQCLRPNYIETIEQTMTDLLPRTIVARMNTEALTLADIKTRYEVYGVGIDKGIIDAAEARRFEGLAPGDVENAAVPFSPPQAIPERLPIQLRSQGDFRCTGCGKKLAEAAGPGTRIRCRCGVTNVSEAVELEERSFDDKLLMIAAMQLRSVPSTDVRIEDGAIRVDVSPPPPAEVNVTVPEREVHVTVEAPAPAVVNVAAAEPSVVNIEPAVVNVTTPEVRVDVQPADIHVDAPVVNIPETVVNVPRQAAPIVNVMVPDPKPTTKTAERDPSGRWTIKEN